MARVTEDRVDLLTVTLSGAHDSSGQREFGSFPRWMNVASKENTDVFWNYGRRQSMDLTCDDEDEYIMVGTKTSLIKKETDEAQILYQKDLIIAIAQTPTIGRPTVKIFTFPVTGEDTPSSLCQDKVILNMSKTTSTDETKEKNPACTHKLKVTTTGCTEKYISWSGKNFVLDIQAKDDKQVKEQ